MKNSIGVDNEVATRRFRSIGVWIHLSQSDSEVVCYQKTPSWRCEFVVSYVKCD